MRLATLAFLGLFTGCAGLVHAPAEGRPEGQTSETALLHGMNPDFLGPAVHHVEVEVDWIEGWAPGDVALEALRAELRHWVPAGAEISIRVDPPISLDQWRTPQDNFAHTTALVQQNGDATNAREDATQLHVVYLPTLRSVGYAGALGVAMSVPHGPRPEDVRASVLLGTDAIQKIAALWIGPRKVERTVLVHELGHVLGLVSDGEHQHRGDPSHCRKSSCLMVSSANKGALLVGAPRAIFLGRLPTSYCPMCRGDLAAARTLFASKAEDPRAWATLQAERNMTDRNTRIAFLLEAGDAEAAVVEMQSWDDADLGRLSTLAQTLRGLGRCEEALDVGRKLVPLDPQGRTVWSRAGPLLDMGRWEEALEEIERAKALGTWESRLEMHALLGAGRVEEADQQLRRLAEGVSDPRQIRQVLRERLWLWRAAGDATRGLELLRTIPRRELKSDRELALEAARLLLAEGHTEEARTLLNPLAQEKKAKHRGEVATIAHARALTGDAEGALRAVDSRSEWFSPGHRLLLRGEILPALNRGDEALAALEEARHRGASPEVPCLDPDLASLRGMDRFQALYRCTPAQAAPAAAAEGQLPGLEALTARVARSPVTLSESWSMLIIGAKLGGELLTSTWLPDPDGPETIDVNFEDWVASAHARLLLDHAAATLARETPPDYAGWPAMQAAAQRSRDSADATRIARIASEGNYGQPWAPFVEAYRSFQSTPWTKSQREHRHLNLPRRLLGSPKGMASPDSSPSCTLSRNTWRRRSFGWSASGERIVVAPRASCSTRAMGRCGSESNTRWGPH